MPQYKVTYCKKVGRPKKPKNETKKKGKGKMK